VAAEGVVKALNAINALVSLPEDLSGAKIHLVGIKGTGMAALAELLCARGAALSGSDVADVFYTDALLAKIGIAPRPFDAANISDGLFCVVYSAAHTDSPELAAARQKHIPCIAYADALGLLSAQSFSAGIAGVHGKTTTTGLAGTVLSQFPLPLQVLAGSSIPSFGGRCTVTKGRRYFIAETCEYRRHFMAFCPSVIVLTSVESDHQDCFPAFRDIRDAFVDYVLRLPQGGSLVYCADDAGAAETAEIACARRPDIVCVPYGKTAEGAYRVQSGGVRDGRQFFRVAGYEPLGVDFALCVPGEHFALNATAAVALVGIILRDAGMSAEAVFSADTARKIAEGLARFRGAKRRSEIIGTAGSLVFADDYAHHPTAIKATLAGFRAFYPRHAFVADFMSHTYSRTQALLGEFASAFGDADTVILHDIYASAREERRDSGFTGETLYKETKKRHRDAHYFAQADGAFDFARSLLETDQPVLFITMGAGDNWKLGARLCAHFAQLEEALCKA
jgi:UDP-N-acetylmuramate--alanine ligase